MEYIKINNDGTIDTSFDIGTGPNDFVWETCVQNDGKILIGGDFTAYNQTAISKIARLDNSVLSTNTSVFENTNFLYPNPTKNTIRVNIDNIKTDATAHIYALTGELIKIELLNKNKLIDLSGLTNGIYLIDILNGTQILSTKIIKE